MVKKYLPAGRQVLPAIFLSIAFVILLMSLSPTIPVQNQLELLPTPFPTPTVTETKWQTYRNEKYGFEIQYPNNWTLSLDNFNNDIIKIENEDNVRITIDPTNELKIKGSIKSWFDTYNKKLLADNHRNPAAIPYSFLPYDKVFSDTSIKPIVIDNQWFDQVGNSYYFIQKNNIYNIDYVYYLNNQEVTKVEPIIVPQINQILSTFKFLPDNANSNLKTHKNSQYGFQFEYPSNYKLSESSTPENRYYLSIISPISPDGGISKDELKMEIYISNNPDGSNLDDYKLEINESNTDIKFTKIIKTKIGGLPVWHQYWQGMGDGELYLFISNDNRFQIAKYPLDSLRNKEFTSIISSFKFTK